ncbi:MAG: hypothetical protein OEV44_00850 [Spirochaetota bacterium]|nr:hypothetical protein [Spirochaetota bacterium]
MGQNIGTFAVVLLLISITIFGLYQISTDVEDNSNLDLQSENLILDINYQRNNNYLEDDFQVTTKPITVNTTFEGVDPYSRQYLEDKSEVLTKKTVIQKIVTAPDLLIKLLGIEEAALIISLRILIDGIILFFLGLVIYKAARTGEVDG